MMGGKCLSGCGIARQGHCLKQAARMGPRIATAAQDTVSGGIGMRLIPVLRPMVRHVSQEPNGRGRRSAISSCRLLSGVPDRTLNAPELDHE